MIKTLQIIATILLTFTVPMITSLLLDWNWIADNTPRYILVLFLMIIEILIGGFVLKAIVHTPDR